jgi:hypothetical protein
MSTSGEFEPYNENEENEAEASEAAAPKITFYKEVAAPEIETAGIADLMRTPADGVNQNTHINWQGARFAVRAAFVDQQPFHAVMIDYPSETSATGRGAIGMDIDLAVDGTPEAVATTSGRHSGGVGRLSDEQKLVVGQLIQRSIDAGEDQL